VEGTSPARVDPEKDDVITEILAVRHRLDQALQATAQELKTMRARCGSLERTMAFIGRNESPERTFAREQLQVLSRRELEVLRAIANGLSTKQIAFELGMTFKTAVSHRTRLMQKLNVHETATLVRLAIAGGLVPATRLPG